MKFRPIWRYAALLLLLWLVFRVFSGSFDKFFNHDSLFYFVNSPHSWGQFVSLLAAPDPTQQYRPLPLGLMSLFTSRMGLDPRPYHWIPVCFHLANAILFWILARRLLPDELSALAAAIYWSLHSAAAYVTYDIGYAPDFLLGFFALSFLILAVEGYRTGSRLKALTAFLLYLGALLCKEAAVTLPLALWVCLVLSATRNSTMPNRLRDIRGVLIKTAPLVSLYFAVALIHAGRLFLWFRSGILYGQHLNEAYVVNPLSSLASKAKYLFWALNLPDTLSIPSLDRNRRLALLLMGILVAAWLVDLLRRRLKPSLIEICGMLWLLGMLVPALALSNRTQPYYLYLPVMGLALAMGSLAGRMQRVLKRLPQIIVIPGILALFLIPVRFSSSVQTRNFLNSSNSAYVSFVVKNCIEDFKELHPTLPPRVTLYLLPTWEKNASEFFGDGRLYQMFYPNHRIDMLFADKGDQLPADSSARSDVWILFYLDGRLYDVTRYYKPTGRLTLYILPTREKEIPPQMARQPVAGGQIYAKHINLLFGDRGDPLPDDYYKRADIWILQYLVGHFSDVTEYYKGKPRDACTTHLVTDLTNVQATVSREEYYPSYDHFETPSGTSIFFVTPEKEIIAQIGGSTAVITMGMIPPAARLRFDVSWMYDGGDGGWAEAAVRYNGRSDVLYRKYMNPNPNGRGLNWEEKTFDLSPYAGHTAELVLTCRNKPGNSTIADWLNWRDIRLSKTDPLGTGCR
jgi:hypothetical protein